MHGISHEHVAREAAALLDRPVAELDQIVLHLGNGASASAIRGGRPVDTSMGLTPLEGLVMGTRAGDLDPGVLLHLLRHGGLDVDGLEDLLHHGSGLQGMAGRTDFRDLQAALDAGDALARAAYDVYCHRLRKYVGAYLAVLGGADVITFTAGVGENVPRLRERLPARAGAARDRGRPRPQPAPVPGRPRVISTDGSPVTVLVVPTHEELAIARQAVALGWADRPPLSSGPPRSPAGARWWTGTTRDRGADRGSQAQSRTSGRSSPCSRVQARARRRVSTISWRSPPPGTPGRAPGR